jgi:uncharacterized protein
MNLNEAAMIGNVELIRQLLTSGASVDERNENGETALHIAAAAGKLNVVIELVSHGAEINAPRIIHGTAINYKPISAAVSHGHLEVTKYLAEKGGKLYGKDGYMGYTNELIGAAASGNLDMVRYLVEEKSLPIDEQDEIGLTPLHISIEKLNYDIICYLIDNGANPDIKHELQPSPLDYARQKLGSSGSPVQTLLEQIIKRMASSRRK